MTSGGMIKRVLARSIFTRRGLAHLHGRRQATNPTEGNRTTPNMVMMGAFVVTLMAALFSLMTVNRDPTVFLRGLNGVATLSESAIAWSAHLSPAVECGDAGIVTCSRRTTGWTPLSSDWTLPERPTIVATLPASPAAPTLTTFAHLRAVLPAIHVPVGAEGQPLVLTLPQFAYGTAIVAVGGEIVGRYFNGERLVAKLRRTSGVDVAVDITLTLHPVQKELVSQTAARPSLVIAEEGAYQRYSDLQAASRSGHGKQLADIARIVLAVFSLLLFLLVDSSPESLGLALFMSLKAVAVVFSQNWLPENLFSPTGAAFLRNFLLCLGDIMQLYFFTQLARIAKPRIGPWLLVGSIIAAAYASAVIADIKAFELPWSHYIWKWRNISIGVACFLTAMTSAVYLATKKLRIRALALTIASSGVIVQIMIPVATGFPDLYGQAWFQTIYHVLETHTPYMFALATFLNISTLESRVKALTKEVVAAKEIEREMALGKTVQQSFLRMPPVPAPMEVGYTHEAALYVSGDIYFVNWDEERQSLTLLINDVTGHGVQAALKASICTTIADSIWCENQVRAGDGEASRLMTYDRRLHSFLSKVANAPEIVSLVGGEFDLRARVMTLYRVNGVFPLALEPVATGGWSARVIPVKNRETIRVPLLQGGFVIFLSDGYVDTSRIMANFREFLETNLKDAPTSLRAHELKARLASYHGFSRSNDDKTMLIFRMQDPAIAMKEAA